MTIANRLHYRPEIDGLRAIAVLAVVLFHASFGFNGGYVGVDVFFVISGFLITSLIWKDLESGRFTFTNFWERRARRILPALIVVTIATLIAGWFLLLPEDFRSLGRATVAQSVFAANIHYWQTTGYFAGASDELPLLHTWSLAVEEQFYLIVPLLLWAMFRVKRLRSRPAVFSLLTIVFVVSLSISISEATARQMSAFYLLPSRAWELLFGSLIAFLPATLLQTRRYLREFLSIMGMILIIVPILLYTKETPFPGLAALPPCLGAALFIWANGDSEKQVPTWIGKFLSTRPLVFVGAISYSLYLWHWPFLAFGKYLALAPLSISYRAAMVGLGFLCAILSWKYVELPCRNRKIGASRKSLFALTGFGLTIVFGCGLLCLMSNGFPHRDSPEVLKFANAKSDFSFVEEDTVEDVRSEKLRHIGVADSSLPPSVFVWGDSHAMAALPAIDAFLKEKGLSGRAATHSSTAPVLDWFAVREFGLSEQAVPFNDSVFLYIKQKKFPHVILSARWSSYDGEAGNHFNDALLTTVRKLNSIGSKPWVLLDVPNHPFDIPKALSLPIYSHSYVMSLYAKPTKPRDFEVGNPKFIAQIKAAGGQILNPTSRFLSQTGQHYIIEINGIALYRDSHHLTSTGAYLVLLPFLRDSLTINAH